LRATASLLKALSSRSFVVFPSSVSPADLDHTQSFAALILNDSF
jgi:hypothetical protein